MRLGIVFSAIRPNTDTFLRNVGEFKIDLLRRTQCSSRMARPRKRHVQQELPFKTWGGKRAGAGRPSKKKRASEGHEERPELRPGSVLLVTTRITEDVLAAIRSLRCADGYHSVRYGLYSIIEREHFRICHISIQWNHLHLIVEADSKDALADGMKGFGVSVAKHLNGSIRDASGRRRRGPVFDDRYHQRLLGGPRQVRNALAYVLNNWRRHGEDRVHPTRKVDPYSSGVAFGGWKELRGTLYVNAKPLGYIPLSVSLPRTWLLTKGWRKAGTVSVHEVPGPEAKRILFGR
jgi:REP element-mobilizing transposase RayT